MPSVNDFYNQQLGPNWQNMMAPTVQGNAAAGYGEREENFKGALAKQFQNQFGAKSTVGMAYDPQAAAGGQDPSRATQRMQDYFQAAQSGDGEYHNGKFYTNAQIAKARQMSKGAPLSWERAPNSRQAAQQNMGAQPQAIQQSQPQQSTQPYQLQNYMDQNRMARPFNPYQAMYQGFMNPMTSMLSGYGPRQDIFGGGGVGPQMTSLMQLLGGGGGNFGGNPYNARAMYY